MTGHYTGTTGTTMGVGAGTVGTGHHGHGMGASTTTSTAGPHESNLANKVDPRVDSDRCTFSSNPGPS